MSEEGLVAFWYQLSYANRTLGQPTADLDPDVAEALARLQADGLALSTLVEDKLGFHPPDRARAALDTAEEEDGPTVPDDERQEL